MGIGTGRRVRRLSGVRGRRKLDRGISGSGTNGQQRYRSRAVHVFGCGARARGADCPSESACQFSSAKRGIFLACLACLRKWSESAFRRFFNLVEQPNPSPEAEDDLASPFQAAEQMAQSVQSQQRPSRVPGFFCDSLGGVTLFEFVDLHFHFLLGIFHGLADIMAHVVSFLLSGLVMRLTYLVCRILRVTPSLLCGTLCFI